MGHEKLTALMASLGHLGNSNFSPHISVATHLEGTEADILQKTRTVVKAIKVSPSRFNTSPVHSGHTIT